MNGDVVPPVILLHEILSFDDCHCILCPAPNELPIIESVKFELKQVVGTVELTVPGLGGLVHAAADSKINFPIHPRLVMEGTAGGTPPLKLILSPVIMLHPDCVNVDKGRKGAVIAKQR